MEELKEYNSTNISTSQNGITSTETLQFATLLNEFKNIASFEEFTKKMVQKSIIQMGENILREYQLDSIIKPRTFLSFLVVYHFPKDVIGNMEMEENKLLYQKAQNVMNLTENPRQTILEYNIEFMKWSNQDLKNMKNEILHYYHSLTVDSLNTKDENLKEEIQKTKSDILKVAKSIGYDEEILKYSPIVINVEELEKEFDRAFQDKLKENIENKNYKLILNTVEFLARFFNHFLKESDKREFNEVLDIEFIKQQIDHDCFGETEWKRIVHFLYQMVKKIHSPQRDAQVENYQEMLHDNSCSLDQHVMNLLASIKTFITDLEALKN